MNESTVSSTFQTNLRKALPGCEVFKHRDHSMIGMVDASMTFNKKTLWCEYKFIKGDTKGVNQHTFNTTGLFSPLEVAAASQTQFNTATRLAEAGYCCYLMWVLDHSALRKRVKRVVLWHPITNQAINLENTDEAVEWVRQFLGGERFGIMPEVFKTFWGIK